VKKGVLVISLDFELVWGLFDHIQLENKVSYFDTTLLVVPQLLELFEKYSINVTWATVGMLFNENWDEWESNKPSILPSYDNRNLCPYAYGEKHRKSNLDNYFFAPKLIKDIQSIAGQELATHTYSHYYCLEKGQTIAQFDADLTQAVTLGTKFNCSLKSLVFPRNQFNKAYLDVCEKHKIETVRSNPENWYWDVTKTETIFTKLVRSGDAYLPFGKKSYSTDTIVKEAVVSQSSSRFLRPQNKIELLNSARVLRIKNEIIQAAKNGDVYHLWWHPHNFGTDAAGAIKSLKSILETFSKCQDLYEMESLTMKQLRDNCLNVHN
jgi:peptidoglycan/xylan/chitin deacetylase (PgdA/CDA1 family)